MSFATTVFLQFFAGFLFAYFLCRKSLTARNALIVAASWLFYGWWDYRFLGLLIFSGCFDFFAGRLLAATVDPRKRKTVLGLSIVINLALLGFFKYYDFFIGSMGVLLTRLHIPFRTQTLGIILPVGISFYTFQSMGYVIDVYRRQLEPTRNLLTYLAFVSFFPQLVAGPIQRGRHLLPQLEQTLAITSEGLAAGTWLVLWGLFKKVVVADNLAPLVEMVFDNPSPGGPAVVSGTLAFAFQIYGDFSGYSDIALGLARLLGFELQPNFHLPYFAADLRDFWRRWHISLSCWLRDYLYISLGGNRKGSARTAFNLMVTMLLGGLWHGAAWNYVLWGAWHGLGLLCTRGWQRHSPAGARLPGWAGAPLTFVFVLSGWLLFRAGSLEGVRTMLGALTTWSAPSWLPHYWLCLLLFVAPLLVMELWQKQTDSQLVILTAPAGLRSGLQGLLLLGILLFWEKRSVPFIYFQF